MQTEAKARETCIFKKGNSRSKFSDGPAPKKAKLTRDERREKIADLSSMLELIENQIKTSQKLMARANDVKDFQQCSTIQKEIMEFFNKKAQVQAELKDHLKKESGNKSYHEKVATSKRSDGSSSSKIADIRQLFSFKSYDDNKSKGIKSGTATVVDSQEEMNDENDGQHGTKSLAGRNWRQNIRFFD